jgi:DNA-binding transcriptional LysR family regulator
VRFDDEFAHGLSPIFKFLFDRSLSDKRHYRHVHMGIDDMADIASSELNLRELRILHALLHERSITRTAELLATTQPGISKVLRHLRAQFGDPLFVRNGHAMQPTAKALEIADQVRTLLGVADSLRASATVFDPARSDRTFSLLLTDVGMIRFLPPLIAHVAAIAPKVNIRAMPLDSRQFELKLEAGEADLALGAFPNAPRHLRRPATVFRRLCYCRPEGTSQDTSREVARRLCRPAAYPHHRLGDRSCRARNGPARARRADTCGKYHAAGPELYRRRHRRGGNRRSHHAAGQSGKAARRAARPGRPGNTDHAATH